MIFSTVSHDELLAERLKHWRDLPSQEFFLELQVRRGRACRILLESGCIGYVIVSTDGVLLEIDLDAAGDLSRSDMAARVVRELGIHRIWSLSFDTVSMEHCHRLCGEPQVLGISCRAYQPKPRLPHEFEARPAGQSDLPAILRINEPDILESPEEAAAYVDEGRLLLFERGTDLLGFGLMTPIMPGRPEVDIGMLVAPAFRGRGYGAAFIQFLAEHSLAHGGVPVCGCDMNNHASRRSLENAGFITEHRLLEFRVRSGERHPEDMPVPSIPPG